jgi:hypothetical protein
MLSSGMITPPFLFFLETSLTNNIVDELGPFLALSGKSMAKIQPWICKGNLFLSYAADFSASWQYSYTLTVANSYKESTFVLLVEVLPNRWQSSNNGAMLRSL